MKKLGFVSLLVAISTIALSDEKLVDYRSGDTVCEGFLASPPKGSKALSPAVLIIHDWNGLDGYEMGRAKMVADLGYYGFAADVYGKGVRPKDNQESAQQAGKYRNDANLFRSRLRAAYDALKATPGVDPKRIVVMGYCFGGGGALELARSGASLAGTVSFHGSLGTKKPATPGTIKAPILVFAGKGDPAVPMTQVDALKQEMHDAKVKCRVIIYPEVTTHAFTVPGPNFNETANNQSWKEFVSFLTTVFK